MLWGSHKCRARSRITPNAVDGWEENIFIISTIGLTQLKIIKLIYIFLQANDEESYATRHPSEQEQHHRD